MEGRPATGTRRLTLWRRWPRLGVGLVLALIGHDALMAGDAHGAANSPHRSALVVSPAWEPSHVRAP